MTDSPVAGAVDRGTAALGRALDRAKAELARLLAPVGRALSRVLAPLDRAFAPLARPFNRYLGGHFGEVTGLQLVVLLGGVVGILAVPLWGPLYSGSMIRTLGIASIWAIFAMSWDVQSGYTGYISFGHSVLSGAAGYTVAMLVEHLDPGVSAAVTIPLAVLAALVLGLLIAVPSLRLEGPYFSLVTFVAVLLFARLVVAYSEWTGGELGLRVTPFTYDPTLRFYLAAIPMLLVAAGLTYVARSNVGLVLVAIRENEPAVSAAGISPTRFKLSSFALSSIPMGIGGVLLAYFGGNVDPNTFVVVDNSIEMIAMAVLGGMSSILAPLFGALLFVFLRDELLRAVFDQSMRWISLWLLVLAVLVFARQGLFRLVWHGLARVGGERK